MTVGETKNIIYYLTAGVASALASGREPAATDQRNLGAAGDNRMTKCAEPALFSARTQAKKDVA